MPKGCYIQLEKKAAQVILNNIRQSYGFKAKLVNLIASFEEDSSQALTLGNFRDIITWMHVHCTQNTVSRGSLQKLVCAKRFMNPLKKQ